MLAWGLLLWGFEEFRGSSWSLSSLHWSLRGCSCASVGIPQALESLWALGCILGGGGGLLGLTTPKLLGASFFHLAHPLQLLMPLPRWLKLHEMLALQHVGTCRPCGPEWEFSHTAASAGTAWPPQRSSGMQFQHCLHEGDRPRSAAPCH